MAQRVRDILLRIRGDASDAENDLHQLARELKQFDGITAEATVDINTTAAERKVKSAENAVKAFGRMSEEAKVDLQARAAQVKLDGLNRNLDNLQKREVTPKVEIAIGKTVAQIERVEAQLDKLDRRRVDINVDVDRRGTAGRLGGLAVAGAGAAAAGISTAAQGLGLFVSAASRGIPIIGGLGQLFIQLGISGAALGPIFLILVPIIGVVLLNAVVMLTGAVVALGASFLVAAAGVGVLGLALAAAFGPVLLVAIAAMARFAKILEAVKAAEDGAAEGARGVRDANQAQAQAQRTAVDAAARVRTTAVDAYRAWRDAAEETSDAIRGITDAELSRERAQLSLKQAKQDLADFRKDAGLTDKSLDGIFKKFTDVSYRPRNLIAAIQKSEAGQRAGVDPLELADKILRVREAQQGVVNANEGVSDATTRANDARERENEFIEKGIDAYAPYTAAVEANEAAQRALAEATDATAEARKKQNEALKDLTPQERRLVDVLVELKDTLTDVFRPATKAIFDGLLDALEDLSDFAKDTGVRRGLRDVGTAIGGMLRSLGRLLRRREIRDMFKEFADAGADIIPQFGRIFRSVVILLGRIARAALPWLKDVVKDIADAIGGVERRFGQTRIRTIVNRIRTSFELWWQIVKDIWDIIVLFFKDANDGGDKLARKIHSILEDWKDWLRKNPDKITDFFENAAEFASNLADSLGSAAGDLKKIADLAEKISDILDLPAKVGRKAGELVFGDESQRKGVTQATIERTIKLARTGNQVAIDNLIAWGFDRQHLHALRIPGYATGGLIRRMFGRGGGDSEPAMLEPGEYVIKRSVAQAIGVGRLNLLNAGNMGALGGGSRGMVIQQQDIHLPPAPGHDQLGDPRHQAVQLARELRRRGQVGIAGGGYP